MSSFFPPWTAPALDDACLDDSCFDDLCGFGVSLRISAHSAGSGSAAWVVSRRRDMGENVWENYNKQQTVQGSVHHSSCRPPAVRHR